MTTWVNKLKIDVIDEEDGSCTIYIEWDENDSDLDYWTSLGPEGQEEFILTALRQACATYTNTEAFDSHVD